MTRAPSMRRLLVQALLLAAVLVGLSRLAGRAPKPDGEAPAGEAAGGAPSPRAQASDLSAAPPDLSFYRTLGAARPSAGGAAPGAAGLRTPEEGARAAGAYVVQALATRDGARARRLRDRLAGRGFPATVAQDDGPGGTVYRVRVGRYRTRAEAEAAARVLRDKLRLSPWILQEAD